jgi:Mn2+/Fe2+ NRAMP family transporter
MYVRKHCSLTCALFIGCYYCCRTTQGNAGNNAQEVHADANDAHAQAQPDQALQPLTAHEAAALFAVFVVASAMMGAVVQPATASGVGLVQQAQQADQPIHDGEGAQVQPSHHTHTAMLPQCVIA